MERIRGEIDWFARHQIQYVFNADSNFGMHKQDKLVAEALVEANRWYGYPEKFRTCYGKNTDDRIFEIATYLHKQGLGKGITLARQSNDEQVLKNIKRANITMSTYQNLQVRFNEEEVPVYSELILGLSGETYETWTSGINGMLESGLANQLFIYQCQVYPNTDMGEPEYQHRFGIKTQRIALAEIHASTRTSDLETEYEDIIVQTNSMPVEQWRRMSCFSWFLMTLHGLKLGFYVMIYLADRFKLPYSDFVSFIAEGDLPDHSDSIIQSERAAFESQLDRMLDGHERAVVLPLYGDLYWDIEEASYLRIAQQQAVYYDQMLTLLKGYLGDRGRGYDPCEVQQVVTYQRMRMPALNEAELAEYNFDWNLPEYFENRLSRSPVSLRPTPQKLVVEPKQYHGDHERFAREIVLWGRKSGTMLNPARWAESTQRLKQSA